MVASFRNYTASEAKFKPNLEILYPLVEIREGVCEMSVSDRSPITVASAGVLDFPHVAPFRNRSASKPTGVENQDQILQF